MLVFPMRTMTGRFSSSPVMASVKKLSLAIRTSSIRPIAPTGVLEPTLTLPVRSTPRLMRSLILAPPGAHLMTMTATKRMSLFETTTATTSTWWFLWMLCLMNAQSKRLWKVFRTSNETGATGEEIPLWTSQSSSWNLSCKEV